jgi:hypothetical protein
MHLLSYILACGHLASNAPSGTRRSSTYVALMHREQRCNPGLLHSALTHFGLSPAPDLPLPDIRARISRSATSLTPGARGRPRVFLDHGQGKVGQSVCASIICGGRLHGELEAGNATLTPSRVRAMSHEIGARMAPAAVISAAYQPNWHTLSARDAPLSEHTGACGKAAMQVDSVPKSLPIHDTHLDQAAAQHGH